METKYVLTDDESKFKTVKYLKDGIWFIKTMEDGHEARFLAEKIEDLPTAMKRAELEPYRYEIASNIAKIVLEAKKANSKNRFNSKVVNTIIERITKLKKSEIPKRLTKDEVEKVKDQIAKALHHLFVTLSVKELMDAIFDSVEE